MMPCVIFVASVQNINRIAVPEKCDLHTYRNGDENEKIRGDRLQDLVAIARQRHG